MQLVRFDGPIRILDYCNGEVGKVFLMYSFELFQHSITFLHMRMLL